MKILSLQANTLRINLLWIHKTEVFIIHNKIIVKYYSHSLEKSLFLLPCPLSAPPPISSFSSSNYKLKHIYRNVKHCIWFLIINIISFHFQPWYHARKPKASSKRNHETLESERPWKISSPPSDSCRNGFCNVPNKLLPFLKFQRPYVFLFLFLIN